MKEANYDKANVNVAAIKAFIDSFSRLSSNNQFVLLGMLKGMVAVNDVSDLQQKGV